MYLASTYILENIIISYSWLNLYSKVQILAYKAGNEAMFAGWPKNSPDLKLIELLWMQIKKLQNQ